MTPRYPTYHLSEDFHHRLSEFTDRFLREGSETFDPELKDIEQFLEQVAAEPNDRDAHSLRLTPKSRYLLELLAYSVYDRLNREAFNRSASTLIVLPDCLSMVNAEGCQKTDLTNGDVCNECFPGCQAYHVSKLARDYGIPVVFSKRKLTEQLEHYREQMPGLGVVGIACILMLADGMRSAMELDIPTRGVLLKGCGCEHWNDTPPGSVFPLKQLKQILEEKHGPRPQEAD